MWVKRDEEIRGKSLAGILLASFVWPIILLVCFPDPHNNIRLTLTAKWLWGVGLGIFQVILMGFLTLFLNALGHAMPLSDWVEDPPEPKTQ